MKYTTEFIRNNRNEVDWKYISAYQNLSEDFIREFEDKIVSAGYGAVDSKFIDSSLKICISKK